MISAKLNPTQRAFLETVSNMAFANPFGPDRARYYRELTNADRDNSADECFDATVAAISKSIHKLPNPRVSSYSGRDRTIIEHAQLFHVFHLFMEQMDTLITSQIATGDGLVPVKFATQALRELSQRGFSDKEALRYFAMFFQLRRAFYFINDALAGQCSAMQSLRMSLWNNIFTHDAGIYQEHLWDRMEDFSTLLLGETGTGKGAAASAIGRSAFIPFNPKTSSFHDNFQSSFICINLSQFQQSLIESELFGHKKGAFTGAIEAHKGLFARCSPHGAIFLDEIGDVSIPLQIKLLQVLQERTFSPVGSHQQLRFHGRVIAATNRPIDELRKDALFRDDFFYRLSSDIIKMPSLRERLQQDPSELQLLVSLLANRITGAQCPDITHLVLNTIKSDLEQNYPWPGNVRELEQCIRRILLTKHYTGDAIPLSSHPRQQLLHIVEHGDATAQSLIEKYCAMLYQRHGTYEKVAQLAGLDRRTAKKYITAQNHLSSSADDQE